MCKRFSNEELVERFKTKLLAENASRNTVVSYIGDIKQLIIFVDKSLLDVDSDEINKFFVGLNVSPATHNKKVVSLKRFYDFLVDNENIDLNRSPVKISKQKNYQKEKEILDTKQVKKLLKYAQFRVDEAETDTQLLLAKRNLAILNTLVASGMRISEVLTLTLDRINIEEEWVMVEAEESKGKKDRFIDFSREVIDSILDYLQLRGEHDTDLIFLSARCKKINNNDIYEMIQKYVSACEIDVHVSPHSFRHYYATTLLKRSGRLDIVQDMLGHSDISTTSKIYVHKDKKETVAEVRKYRVI